MFWKKKNKRVDLEMRAPKRRKSFFERKEDGMPNPLFSKFIFRFVLFLFIISVGYILFFSPFLEIKTIQLSGVSELKEEDIRSRISEIVEEKYFRFVPKSNFILLPSSQIRSELLNSFKKISNVEIKKVFPDGITVDIVERKALLIWCSAGPCYIVDEDGYAYAWVDLGSEEAKQNNLLSIADNSGKEVKVGEKVLSADYVTFAVFLGDEMERETGINIRNEYQTGSRMAEEVRVATENGWQIYFSTVLPMDASIRTLKTFLEKEVDQSKQNELEYVDLRAENKVYYKFKNQEGDAVEEQKTEEIQQSKDAVKKDTDKKKKNN